MSFVGMNIEEVQQLAQQMQHAASELQQIIGQITGALNNAQWVGPDATRFRSDWQSLHTQALTGVANGLNQAAQTANTQAQKQQAASS